MAISNSEKRRLTCRFCKSNKPNCFCKKKWKEVYKAHREEILELYHKSLSEESQE